MIDYQTQIDQSVEALFENISRRLSSEDMVRIERAYLLAAEAHSEQRRKSGEPYIIHPIAVARIIAEELELGANPIIAAFLHDVVEGTDWTFEALLKEGFPTEIIDALRCVTKISDDEPYDEFIERVKTNPLAVAVKINDLTDNMDVRRYNELTDRDVNRLRKYLKAYRELTRIKK